jgi:phosphoglycolate phosphatase-like HAD superfamily hydrolase
LFWRSTAFDSVPLVCRDNAAPKPDPKPIRLACKRLEVSPEDAWMIGDGRYDGEAAIAADVRTVWISHDRERPFAAQPWRCVSDLVELREMLRQPS